MPRERWGYPFLTICAVIRLLRARHIDVLHTVFLQSDVIGAFARLFARTPVHISSVEGRLIPSVPSPLKKYLYRAGNVIVRSQIDKTIVISHGLCEMLEHNGDVVPQRTTVIHSGVDVPIRAEHAQPSGRPQTVGVMARFSPEKGILSFVRSISMIRARHSSTQFVIAGDGPERAEIEREIRAADVEGQVQLIGWQSDANTFLAGIDILVIPSLEEGLPWVLLDAVACRVAVVATNVGGNPDVIRHAETGLLVPPDNPLAIANAVISLIDNPGVRERYIEQAVLDLKGGFQSAQETNSIQELYVSHCMRRPAVARTC